MSATVASESADASADSSRGLLQAHENEKTEEEEEEKLARLAGAKLIGGLQLLHKVRCELEDESVYGAVILMPQVARSLGWPQDVTAMVCGATISHILCMIIHAALLMYVDKEEKVMDGFAGQMYLCDFGADLDSCDHESMSCLGPGGTIMSYPRLYSWGQWVTRSFLRDSFKALFPHKAHAIPDLVDPGEYGVESFRCRLLCCLVLILSILPEIMLCWQMANLLIYLPSQNESWVSFKSHEAVEKRRLTTHKKDLSHRKDWMEQVDVRVAGMGLGWKAWNALFVLLPKVLLVYYTAKAGIEFLMETAGIDDIIVNSVALGFLLSLDELITSALMSPQARLLLSKCEGRSIAKQDEEDEILTDAEILERFYHGQKLSGGGLLNTVKDLLLRKYLKLYLLFGLTALLVFHYYHWHCDFQDGRYVSKAMYGPKTTEFTMLNAFLPELFPLDVESEPYWTMPDGEFSH